tara:strand:+ start:150 stop:1124 length:975 start_codon:yes stop_codon:yes gene_type:complete
LKLFNKAFLEKIDSDNGPSQSKSSFKSYFGPETKYLINGYKSYLFFLCNKFSNSFIYHLESLKSLSCSNSIDLRCIAYAWLLLYDITGDYRLTTKKKAIYVKEIKSNTSFHRNLYAAVPYFVYQKAMTKKNKSESLKMATLIGPGDIKKDIYLNRKIDSFIIFNTKGPNSDYFKNSPIKYIYTNSLQFNDAKKYQSICKNKPKLIGYPKENTDLSYQDSKYTKDLFIKDIFLFGRPHQGIISLINMLEMKYDEIYTYGMSFFLNIKGTTYKKSNFLDMNARLAEHSLFQCYAIFLSLVKLGKIKPEDEHLHTKNVKDYSNKLDL